MGLIQEYVDMKISTYNIEHYKNKGYDCIDGETIKVRVCDLSEGSGVKIDVECDYCGAKFKQAYRRYLEHSNDIACMDCRYYKVAKTNLERYGNTCSLRNKDVLQKAKDTCKKRYGVEYSLQNKQIQKQTKITLFQHYGVTVPAKNKTILKRMNEAMKMSDNSQFISTSKIQRHLCDLYNGVLNYKVDNFYVDMYLQEYNICCEYDGGGHNLSVKHSRITQEELDKKDDLRNMELINRGYKVFRIVSSKDTKLTDKEFLNIKDKAIQNLIYNNYNLYVYNIDNQSEKSFKM